MHALITGGAGFIGSHLSEALLGAGHQVQILDNLSTGSIENITHLKGRGGFKYHIDSVNNEPLLAELVDAADVVFHFAAAVGVKLIVEQPVHTIETNVHGTEVVLKHANKKKKLVVLASTSEVYGKSENVPFREDSDLVLGPTTKHRWAYACSKAIDEFLALAYWKERKLPVIIVRFFNTVGPRQTGQYGMVIPNFVRQALAGEPMTVFGDGTQRRSFTHVSDVVGALIALMNEPKAIGQVVNIGNTEEVTIQALAERVRAMTGSQSPIKLIPYDQAYESGFEDMPRRLPDLTKIRAMIDYEPTRRLDDILADVIEYFADSSRYTEVMRMFGLGVALAGVMLLSTPAFAEVQLSIKGGRVSLSATNATVSQILAEWARIGHTRIVNGERVPGGPMTLELKDVPEVEALEILLRSAGGYLLAERNAVADNLSRYDRILIVPVGNGGSMGVARPIVPQNSAAPTFPRPQLVQPPPQPADDDNAQPDRPTQSNSGAQGPPGDGVRPPVFNRFPPPQTPQEPQAAPPPARPATTPQVPVGVSVPGMPTPQPTNANSTSSPARK